ncbi:MAG: hypothetical protein RMJ98_05680 [Myxococcales bacterium]|nr:ImmA/IrrE family metallo-endopeptidase [Polyangiaceae bacterium]MDW8248782.1 hypothetical protein [Myxococcales bacterium]
MLRKVEAVRQLQAKTPVRSVVLPRKKMLNQVQAQEASNVPAQVTRAQGLLLQALGWVPPGYDHEQGTLDLLNAQLAGYYAPRTKTMFLAQDLPPEEARATLAHELVHALQDQHYDLEPKLRYRPESGDEPTALHALAEGDATSTMFDVLLASSQRTALDLPEEVLIATMQEQTLGTAEDIPPSLKLSLIAPYIDGLRFVHALRRRGGWAEVDRAWRTPPTTTEQILHLEKYDRREPPLPVPGPPVDALGGGFRVELTDQVGEQGLRIMLESWGTPREARRAAAGWGGDRVTLLTRVRKERNEWFVTWWIRFDGTDAQCPDVTEAFAVVRKGLSSDRSISDTACQERAEMGPLAASVAHCDLLLAAGPFVQEGTSWRSHGNCSEVRSWIRAAVQGGSP